MFLYRESENCLLRTFHSFFFSSSSLLNSTINLLVTSSRNYSMLFTLIIFCESLFLSFFPVVNRLLLISICGYCCLKISRIDTSPFCFLSLSIYIFLFLIFRLLLAVLYVPLKSMLILIADQLLS